MRSLAIAHALVALLALLAASACAITDYPVITDTEGDEAAFIVNTNGKALIRPDPFWGQGIIIWPDQSEELFTMVDQQSDGDRKLDTYVNVSFGGTSDVKFLDFEYCNPDWTGCSVLTSFDPNVPGDPFFNDFTWNTSCSGARSVENLLAYTERLGECGRALLHGSSLEALADWAGSAVEAGPGGAWHLAATRANLRLTAIDPLGNRRTVPVYGVHELIHWPGRGSAYRYRPNAAPTALEAVRLSREFGVTRWEIEYLGHAVELRMMVLDTLADRVRTY